MNAMIDAQCKCGKRIGWCGTMANRPTCPRCGFRPPQEELDAADAKMQEDRRLIALDPMRATRQELYKQRIVAGLTLRQAAKLLGMFPSDLSDLEHSRAPLTEEIAAKMRKTYGVGE